MHKFFFFFFAIETVGNIFHRESILVRFSYSVIYIRISSFQFSDALET